MKIYISVLLWIYSVYLVESTSIVIHTSTPTNWSDASRKCKDDGQKLEFDESVLSGYKELNQKEFWIGIIKYNKLMPWIEPKDCYRYTNGLVIANVLKDTKGYCQQHCQASKYFGFKDSTKECRCFDDNISQIFENTTYSQCFNKSFENKTVLLYQESNATNSEVGNEKCMVVNCDTKVGKKLIPKSCDIKDQNIQTVCDDFNLEQNSPWALDYTEANLVCIQLDKKLLSPYWDGCYDQIKGRSFWSSAFREAIEVEDFEVKPEQVPNCCLSGTMDNSSEIILKCQPCDKGLNYFVCSSVNGTGITTSNYSSQESTSASLSSYTKTDSPHTETTSHITADTETTDPDHTRTTSHIIADTATSGMYCDNLHHIGTTSHITADTATSDSGRTVQKSIKTDNGSKTTGSLVGGIVGGITIIVSTLLVILYIRRKRNTQSETKMTKTTKTISNTEYDLAVTTPNSIFTGNNYVSENGDILNSLQIQSTSEYSQVDVSRHSTNDDLYNISSEGDYDKLNNVSSRKNTNDTNHYGIVGQCGEDEYDTMIGALQVKRTEDLYDTNVPLYGGKGDSTYDTANSFKHRQMDQNSTYGYSP